jgi:hypothetical protein
MTQATHYTRTTGFADDERNNAGGRSTVATADVDFELDAIAQAVNLTIDNLALIQRDDGVLRDGAVPVSSLGADTLKLMAATGTPRGAWVTATVYAAKDIVTQSGNTYMAVSAHTSGTFATDLATVKWVLLQIGANPAATAVPFSPTANILSNTTQAAIVEVDTNSRTRDANLADTADPLKGAGLLGFNYLLSYGAGTLGKWLKDLAGGAGASFIGFLQTGVNAVTQSIQVALRQVVRVTDFATVQDATFDVFTNGGQLFFGRTAVAAVGNIPNFHAIQKTGRGTVTRGADTFYINPDANQTNTLYVDPAGNDSNDGLTATLPFKTLQAAINAIASYGPYLRGNWIMQLAAGTYTDGATFPTGLGSQNYIQVNGPSAALPFIPTAIIDGTAPTVTVGLNQNGRNNVHYTNLLFRNWTAGGTGILAQLNGVLFTTNCYFLNCDNAIKAEQTRLYVNGGIVNGGVTGITSISCNEHTVGYGGSQANAVNNAVTGASGTGSVATLTFAALGSAPVVGSTLVVRGMTPTGYNGVWIVTASTTTTVSYACTATGAMTIAGTFGYNYGCNGVGTLIVNCSQNGGLFQESGTGHLDTTTIDNCGNGLNIVSSARANCQTAAISNCTIGIRSSTSSNWLNGGVTFTNNATDYVDYAFSMEINRCNAWTSEMRQPVDIAFVTQTGTTSQVTIKTYADAIQTNSFNGQNKSYRMKFSGSITGSAGTKNISIQLAGSPAAGFTLAAGYVGSYVFEMTVTAQSGASQSVEAWCIVDGQNPRVFDGSRSIGVVTGAQIPATILIQNGSAADTVTCRKVDRFTHGGA